MSTSIDECKRFAEITRLFAETVRQQTLNVRNQAEIGRNYAESVRLQAETVQFEAMTRDAATANRDRRAAGRVTVVSCACLRRCPCRGGGDLHGGGPVFEVRAIGCILNEFDQSDYFGCRRMDSGRLNPRNLPE
jgi:hypothetical protein